MLDNRIDVKYLRLSLEDGDVESGSDRESCSIGSQRRCIDNYIASHTDLDGDFEDFIDDGYSGTSMDRPAMRRLLRLVEEGRVRTIIVRDLSRFARDYLEAGHFLEFVFPAYEVRFISINEEFDSAALGEDTGGMELAVRNLVNYMYSKDTSRRIKSVVDLKKLSGEFVYGFAPYGYKKGAEKNTIVIDDEAAMVVKRIFKWAISGITISQIAKKLNDSHTMTPSMYLRPVRGDKYKVREFWTYESVHNILTNRIYTGDTQPFKSHVVRVGSNRVKQIPEELRQIVPNTHEAIIGREEYYQARLVIKSNKKPRPQPSTNPFAKLLVCGCCGNKLQKGRKTNKDWLCATARYTEDLGCQHIRVNESMLHEIVLRAINTQIRLLDEKLKQVSLMSKTCKSEHDVLLSECSGYKNRLNKIHSEKMRYYEEYVSGSISKEKFASIKAELTTEEEALKLQLKMANDRLSELSSTVKQQQQAVNDNKHITRHGEIEKLTPELAKELIKKITIYNNDRINIEWNFFNELENLDYSSEVKVS